MLPLRRHQRNRSWHKNAPRHKTPSHARKGEGPTTKPESCTKPTAAMAVKALKTKKTKIKHIDYRQYWARCLRDRGICTLSQCHVIVDTKENLADLFTKILDSATFERLRDQVRHDCQRRHTCLVIYLSCRRRP